GPDYSIDVQMDNHRVRHRIGGEHVDALIVNLDASCTISAEQLAFLAEIKGAHVPVVVMTDDNRRCTAMELVGHGVYDYFRKPPSLVELKLVVGRAHEHARLKRELEKTRETLRAASSCDQLIGSSV